MPLVQTIIINIRSWRKFPKIAEVLLLQWPTERIWWWRWIFKFWLHFTGMQCLVDNELRRSRRRRRGRKRRGILLSSRWACGPEYQVLNENSVWHHHFWLAPTGATIILRICHTRPIFCYGWISVLQITKVIQIWQEIALGRFWFRLLYM